MSFLRPPVQAALLRWGESGALALFALVLGWAGWRSGLRGGAVMPVVWGAGALVLAGLALSAFRKARLARDTSAPGVVTVTEWRIGYMGPVTGGFVDLPALNRISLSPGPDGPVWHLQDDGGRALAVPAAARGAERLYDALSPLPGFNWPRALALIDTPPARPVTLWEKPGLNLRRP
ncbi:hypothetical protein FDP22_20235 (plasmid) [Paroceanicella profunda]|uniref:DUF4175 domain-containing protein n=1 Tax=Paroceanicella profunda TaxID=2579971 RepID=A0A5B8G285_9RHOB|nr:hypothetical protein [Paroceanicella profunda]QDL94184.1 hypothetical protein FDP22_20235 [Paroceanicella profunda]